MKCRAVQQLISAERDGALGGDARDTLESHLAGCAACRQMRATLAESAAAWRVTTASARAPDERLEWQRIRRRLNGGDEARDARPAWSIFTLWRGASLAAAAAAAVAFGLFVAPRWFEPGAAVGAPATAMTEFVEVGGDASSAMVFVDQKSGWLVVWAAGATD